MYVCVCVCVCVCFSILNSLHACFHDQCRNDYICISTFWTSAADDLYLLRQRELDHVTRYATYLCLVKVAREPIMNGGIF